MRPATVVLLLAALPPPAGAAPPESTAACHCYTNRVFDPVKPAAADPYILATTRSSLLSAAYGVGKATLVQDAMAGVSPDDMWIAFWAGARTGRPPDVLLSAKGAKGTWKAALAETGTAGLGEPFTATLARGGTPAELSAIAVDDVLASRLGATAASLAALRKAGASSTEVILSTLLAPRLRVTPAEVLARFRSGKVTWGMLLDEAGLTPKGIDSLVRGSLR
ncbi:MAG: hypothetical protein WB493_07755 [Anaeromyxobacteraceae bacterium]